jgi:general secretion pathway protein L
VTLDEPGATPDEERIRASIRREIVFLSREIEITTLSVQPQENEPGPELVVLTGGGSLIGGLAPALEMALGIPVLRLGDLEDLGLFNHFKEAPSDLALFAVPAGIALTDKRKIGGFNFQEKELRTRGLLMKWRQHLRYALVASLVILLSWLGSVGVDIYVKKQRLKQLDKAIEKVFRRALPELKGSVRSPQYASILQAKIKELNESVAMFGPEAGHLPAVKLILDINQAVPPELNVNVTLLTIDRQRVRITGRADAFNTVDTVKNRLAASDAFATVSIAGAKAAADGKGVQFSLDLRRSSVSGEGE